MRDSNESVVRWKDCEVECKSYEGYREALITLRWKGGGAQMVAMMVRMRSRYLDPKGISSTNM